MRIFIAGATGVVGRRLVPQLIDAGHEVTAVVRAAGKRETVSRQGARPVHVDLFDAVALRAAVAGQDAVINLATHIPPSSRAFLPGAWRENDRIRRVASRNLVDAAIAGGAARFVQESFAPIYPDRGDEWIDEGTPVRAARYNRSVLDAEAAAARLTRSGRTGVVLRFALFYGPDSSFTLDTISYVRKGWAPALGAPDGFVSSVSHDDAATAVVAALAARAGIYNVVDDEPMRRRDYYGSLAAALGVAPPKFPPAWLARVTGSLGETLSRSQRISNRKLKEESGWRPATRSVRDGWPHIVAATASVGRSEQVAESATTR
ncbi:MAG: NAD-dependent epimerase/dehydratase family protein [Gemmatimonadaceae bacterium]